MQEVHAISMGQEPPNLQECCFNMSPVSAKQQTNKQTNKRTNKNCGLDDPIPWGQRQLGLEKLLGLAFWLVLQ